jgi:hypothetical protein
MRKRMPLILTIVILLISCGVMVQPTSTPPAPALAATPTFDDNLNPKPAYFALLDTLC